MLHRLDLDSAWLKRELASRPNLKDYFERVKKRPSTEEANVNTIVLPNTFQMAFGISIVFAILTGLITLVWFLIDRTRDDYGILFAIIWLSINVLFWIIINILACTNKAKFKKWCDEVRELK